MSDLVEKTGPNEADSPSIPPEDANVFGYNVASEASNRSVVSQPNPNSPLAAG